MPFLRRPGIGSTIRNKRLFLFVFWEEYLCGARPSAEGDRKSVLADVFADVEWECAQILAAMMNAWPNVKSVCQGPRG